MAWGIAMTAFTLIGMLALLVASVQSEEPRFRVYLGKGPGSSTFPQAEAVNQVHPDGDTEKAA
jgi:hypothetical protein